MVGFLCFVFRILILEKGPYVNSTGLVIIIIIISFWIKITTIQLEKLVGIGSECEKEKMMRL